MNRKHLLTYVLILLGLVLLAWVSEFFVHSRLDLTENKQYTLSEATKDVLSGLDQKLEVRAVFSENLPAQFARLKTHIQDLLQEVESAGGGQVELVFEDPGLDSTRKAEVLQQGIQEIQVTEQTRDGAVAKRGFFGMILKYGEKTEVVPLISNLESFEYDLVVRAKKLSGDRPVLGVLEGTGPNKLMFFEPGGQQPAPRSGFDQVFPSLHNELQRLYDVRVINADSVISDDISLLVVAAPKSLSEKQQYVVDQYIMQGRNAIFLSPAVEVNFFQGIQATPAESNYMEMLKHYGFDIQTDLVLDVRHASGFFGRNNLFGTPYPLFPGVDEEDLNRNNVVTSKLGALVFPWVSSMQLASDTRDSTSEGCSETEPCGVRNEILVQTTPEAWTIEPPFDITPKDPAAGEQYIPTAQSRRVLAAIRTGKFTSAFPNGSSVDTSTPGEPAAPAPETQVKQAEKDASILVVPNYLFLTDFFIRWSSQGISQNTTENLNFFINAADYLALDPRLISIRSRTVIQRPLDQEAWDQRHFWIVFNLIAAPVILGLIGLGVFLRRRRKVFAKFEP